MTLWRRMDLSLTWYLGLKFNFFDVVYNTQNKRYMSAALFHRSLTLWRRYCTCCWQLITRRHQFTIFLRNLLTNGVTRTLLVKDGNIPEKEIQFYEKLVVLEGLMIYFNLFRMCSDICLKCSTFSEYSDISLLSTRHHAGNDKSV